MPTPKNKGTAKTTGLARAAIASKGKAQAKRKRKKLSAYSKGMMSK